MGVMSDWLWRDGGFLSELNCDRSFVNGVQSDGGNRSGSQSLRGWVEIGLLGGYHAGSVGPTVSCLAPHWASPGRSQEWEFPCPGRAHGRQRPLAQASPARRRRLGPSAFRWHPPPIEPSMTTRSSSRIALVVVGRRVAPHGRPKLPSGIQHQGRLSVPSSRGRNTCQVPGRSGALSAPTLSHRRHFPAKWRALGPMFLCVSAFLHCLVCRSRRSCAIASQGCTWRP